MFGELFLSFYGRTFRAGYGFSDIGQLLLKAFILQLKQLIFRLQFVDVLLLQPAGLLRSLSISHSLELLFGHFHSLLRNGLDSFGISSILSIRILRTLGRCIRIATFGDHFRLLLLTLLRFLACRLISLRIH